MAHLMFRLRRLPHLTREQFQEYWSNVHGPLVRSHAQALGLSEEQKASVLHGAQVSLSRVGTRPPARGGRATDFSVFFGRSSECLEA